MATKVPQSAFAITQMRAGKLCVGVCQLCTLKICWGQSAEIPWRSESKAVVCKRCRDEHDELQRQRKREELEAELLKLTNVVVLKRKSRW